MRSGSFLRPVGQYVCDKVEVYLQLFIHKIKYSSLPFGVISLKVPVEVFGIVVSVCQGVIVYGSTEFIEFLFFNLFLRWQYTSTTVNGTLWHVGAVFWNYSGFSNDRSSSMTFAVWVVLKLIDFGSLKMLRFIKCVTKFNIISMLRLAI